MSPTRKPLEDVLETPIVPINDTAELTLSSRTAFLPETPSPDDPS